MGYAAVSVSVMALLFTVGSFWWLNGRRGRLVSFEPVQWSGYVHPPRSALRLPVVLHNPGAVPIIVTAMRLRFTEGGEEMLWEWTHETVEPRPSGTDQPEVARPLCVVGRSVLDLVIAVAGSLPDVVPHPRPYPAVLEAKLSHADDWHTLVSFDLQLQNMKHPGNYITYTNSPDYLTADELAEGAKELAKLRVQHGLHPAPDPT